MRSRPNLLFVLVDCLRWDRATGAAGASVIPHLATLREAGTSFDTTIATVSCTSPSVASLMTGCYPPRHGVLSMRGYRLARGLSSLAGLLAAAGYHTRAEVTGPLVPALGLDRGFAVYRHRPRGHNLYSPFGAMLGRLAGGGMPEPWFLFLHLWELHTPRKVLRRFRGPEFGESPYDRALTSLDTRLGSLLAAIPKDRTIVALSGDHGERLQEVDHRRRTYRFVCRWPRMEPFFDAFRLWRKRHTPRIVKRLRRVKGATASHGFHVYDDLVKVPLFLSGAPFPLATRIPDQVRHVDLLPTLLDAVGEADRIPDGIDGRSLMPLVRNEPLPPAFAYMEATGRNLKSRKNWVAGIRTPAWKYARRISGEDPAEELYDLEADPEETENVAGTRSDRVAEMRRCYEEVVGASAEVEEMTPAEIEELDERLRGLGYLE